MHPAVETPDNGKQLLSVSRREERLQRRREVLRAIELAPSQHSDGPNSRTVTPVRKETIDKDALTVKEKQVRAELT